VGAAANLYDSYCLGSDGCRSDGYACGGDKNSGQGGCKNLVPWPGEYELSLVVTAGEQCRLTPLAVLLPYRMHKSTTSSFDSYLSCSFLCAQKFSQTFLSNPCQNRVLVASKYREGKLPYRAQSLRPFLG